ncbi:MAG: glycosyltransferase family 4 protein [Acidimicrobiia bacterium]|nr:glycosyltransferase family 4 protein [Acidimicrobiia bacterium]
MKIALVCPYDLGAVGGVQGQVVSLVAWLREAGHEAWAVAPGSGGPPGTVHVGRVVTVPANRSRAPISLDPRVPARVREAVAGAEVVHVHEPLVPLVGPAALRPGGPPRVGTFHADPGAVVRRLYGGAAPLLRRLAGRLAVATAVSPVAAAGVQAFTKVRIIPNGLDTARYRVPVVRAARRVVFLGRDDPRKGLDVLLQAWPVVAAAVPGAELRVLGARRDSGPTGVLYLGRVDEAVKLRELGEAAVLCAPNLGGESFGLVVAEGLAAGCAVVASDLPAFRHVAGEAARLIAPGDAAALGRAIIEVLSDEGEAARLAGMGRHRALVFDRAAVLEGYLAAYREAVGGA